MNKVTKSRYEFCSLPQYTHTYCILRFKLVTNKLPSVGKPDEFMTSPGLKHWQWNTAIFHY